jgi:hypothetical protein
MAELDDRLLRDLARLRERSSPPPGAEQRVHAALETALWPGPGGGDGGAAGGLGSAGAKLLAATAAATGTGVLIIKLGVMPTQQTRDVATAPVEVSATKISNDEPRSPAQPELEPEPPIVGTPT